MDSEFGGGENLRRKSFLLRFTCLGRRRALCPTSAIRLRFDLFTQKNCKASKRVHDRVRSHDRSEHSRRADSICIAAPPDMHDVRPEPTLFHELEFRSFRKLTDADSANRRLALRPKDLARRKDHKLINQPC